jgi:arsenite methyltransferase
MKPRNISLLCGIVLLLTVPIQERIHPPDTVHSYREMVESVERFLKQCTHVIKIKKEDSMESTTLQQSLDIADLEKKVKSMYRDVALDPNGEYHFEMGRRLAEKLGYQKDDLDATPGPAIDSFAGVGYFFDLAAIKSGEKVLDLGCGSGMDTFIAALKVGRSGHVTGVDMTNEQLAKANRLAEDFDLDSISFIKGRIEELQFDEATFDVVISNGVINLCPEKERVFSEIARVLKPGGRMAIADIVTERHMPDSIVCNSTLWASCIGGATQEDTYKTMIENPGMDIIEVRRNNAYQFLSKSARGASDQYGVKSVSLLARRQ